MGPSLKSSGMTPFLSFSFSMYFLEMMDKSIPFLKPSDLYKIKWSSHSSNQTCHYIIVCSEWWPVSPPRVYWSDFDRICCMFYTDSFSLRNITMELGGLRNRITAWLIVLIVSFVAVLRSVPSRVTASLSSQAISRGNYSAEFPQEIEFLEEFWPPSSPGFTENGTHSSVLRRLGELEEKLQELEAKQSQMPPDREELLNGAIHRVDALEAELISTKKVLLSLDISYALCGCACVTRKMYSR